MRDRVAHADKVWRRMKLFFYLWPFWGALIIGLNIWRDAQEHLPFDWTNLFGGIGVIAGGGGVFLWCWLVFKVVRGISSVLDRQS